MSETCTRQDFQAQYNLSEEDVQLTLNAIGFSAKKRKFNQDEQKLFAEARELLTSDRAVTWEQLREYFQEQGVHCSKQTDLGRTIEQEAIETGVQIGMQQGDIIAEVIPKAAMYRLQEKIANGELRESFSQLWTEAMGKSENLEVMIEQRLKKSQLEESPSPTNLLPSSMESSENG